ncbi:glycosyltransferase family 39 protein [bacterium]|nr:glycosyltransferase family 39 protein [candidate division CSSED10-310 bacterium]
MSFQNCKLIILLCLMVCFTGIIDRELWTPDEPRVAAISLEMSRTGDLIIPRLAGAPFVEKPPLYFAGAGLAIRVLGDSFGIAGATRLTTVFWGLGVLLFTGLIARRLFGLRSTLPAMAILATMAGFVENFHWIRVDAALAFFVTAAVWAIVEGFETQCSRWFVLSGVFSIGAFLSKGFIGALLIFVPFAGMIIARKLNRENLLRNRRDTWAIMIGAILFFSGVLTWLMMFKITADAATWHEFFHVNHIGRFNGESTHKGHMHPHDPVYYVKTVLLYTMPWMPFVIAWFVKTIRNYRSLPKLHGTSTLFLFLWTVGTYLLLSLPSTKRDVYLLPVLPAFAIMASQCISGTMPKWCQRYCWFITVLCLVLLIVFTVSPWITVLFVKAIPAQLQVPLSQWSIRHAICALSAIFCGYIALSMMKKHTSHAMCLFTSSALLFFGFFLVPMHIIDVEKNLEPGIHNYLAGIPEPLRDRVAGWNFSGTMLGLFYVYGDWAVPQITSRERLDRIIAGCDEEYDSIIINQEESIPDLISRPYTLLRKGHPHGTKKKRILYWIRGNAENPGI